MDWRHWLVDYIVFRRIFLIVMFPFTMLFELVAGLPRDSKARCLKEWGIFLELWDLMAPDEGQEEGV